MKTIRVILGIPLILTVFFVLSCSKSTDSTSNSKPVATTQNASGIGPKTAILNGTVNANGQMVTVKFEYGTSTSYGSTVNASQYYAQGDTNTTVNVSVAVLKINTTYHYRVVAISGSTTINGSDVTFTTASSYNLNGLWDNGGQSVIQINGTSGTFYSISGGNWLNTLNAGLISIGSEKLRNIAAVTDSTWSCDDLWWHETGGVYDYTTWSDQGTGSMGISADGNSLTVTSTAGSLGTSSYTLTRMNATKKAVATQATPVISTKEGGNN